MALSDVIDAVVDVCGELSLADQVLTEPPARLPDDRCFVVTGSPGTATLTAHRGRGGNVVYESEDDVIVTWFRKTARDAMAEGYPEALDAYLSTRDGIFVALLGPLGSAISGFVDVTTDLFGAIDFWLPDTAFGFQLSVTVRHQTEAGT